jgi:ribonuclease Z
MKVTFLGTGNALVTEYYNTCFVITDKKKRFLVDGGGGNEVLRRLKSAGIDLKEIHDIFVTHKHIDHILGVVWLLRIICQKMKKGDYDGELRIYGHDEVISLINRLADMLLQKKQTELIGDRVQLIVVNDGETKEIIGRKITFFDIESTKAKQYGFCMESDDGEKLVCCGDEPYCEKERPYAENCKYFMHEAFCLHSEADIFKPYEKNHSTVKDACELARKLNVKNVILYHTEDKNYGKRKALYIEEGKKYFDGNIIIPDDMETIEL